MIPAFSAWTESPEPGISTSRTVSAIPITSTSLCPAPTVSRKTRSLPGRVEDEQRLERRLRETAEMAARAHRADEDARVEEVVGEPDAIAEQRALRERARRVDGDHADRLLRARGRGGRAPLIRLDLPTPGRAGDADRVRAAGLRVDVADELVGERVAVLDERDRARERARVARADAGGERLARPVPPRATTRTLLARTAASAARAARARRGAAASAAGERVPSVAGDGTTRRPRRPRPARARRVGQRAGDRPCRGRARA